MTGKFGFEYIAGNSVCRQSVPAQGPTVIAPGEGAGLGRAVWLGGERQVVGAME